MHIMNSCSIYFISHKLSDLNGAYIMKEVNAAELRKMADTLVIDDNDFYLSRIIEKAWNLRLNIKKTLLASKMLKHMILSYVILKAWENFKIANMKVPT